jgi:AraC-like DNA-binding protein
MFVSIKESFLRIKMRYLYIKNMVCDRCIMVVKQILNQFNIPFIDVNLGEVLLANTLSKQQKDTLDKALTNMGFEILDDKKSKLIEQIKVAIIDLVHHQQLELKNNLSEYISQKLHHDYGYLSNLFSEVEGTTIEQYFIAQKIEKVKELLVYEELTLNQIAADLNYSSVAHLSNQFKKVTGMTPTNFKKIKSIKRKTIDKV